MKQLRWVLILGITVLVLFGVFLVVDHYTKKKEEEQRIGEPQQLLLIDSSQISRITVDNEDGHFAFDWDQLKGWQLVSSEQFEINSYAVSAMCNYICNLSSLKTVAFDCKDTSVYGFDAPITIKVYTTESDPEQPYVLFVGDATPTYDAYYVMLENSDDVYTIDYNSGTVFCSAKDMLKNTYLMDVTSSQFNYYRLEHDGKTVTEFGRTEDASWDLRVPSGFTLYKVRIDDLVDTLTRMQVSGFVEEHPQDLAKYGLDKPHSKIFLEGNSNGSSLKREIWFGSETDNSGTEIYGYVKESEQVFRIIKNTVSFIEAPADRYILPNCISVSIEELESVEIDMGEVYDMHEVLHLDYENKQYALGDTDITAMNDETLTSLFTAYYRAVTQLSFTALDLDAKPEPDEEPAIRILYTYLDGHTAELTFCEKEENNYYLFRDGSYTGMTVRLNEFSERSGIIKDYEALKAELQ
ncbi:MAG: DUF4340 domain-containing protein [Oscillospiraceae bacterium]|nr:DUF4340 domain-containing protein [Oscillospiraceae bacterium]